MHPASVSKPKRNLLTPLIILGAVLVVGGGTIWYLERERPAASGPVLTPEAKAYVRNLGLSEVEMKARENTLQQTVVEITGKITNKGDRVIRYVALNCVFYDPYGQLVLRERVPIVKAEMKPGDTRAFRLPFDTIPPSWNQSMPQLVIAQIQF